MKDKIYERCREFVAQKILLSQQSIKASQETANSETKSSAGDKYETTRAMMQIEIQNNSKQLAEAQDLQGILNKITFQESYEAVALGSLVKTSEGIFFIAIGMGLIKINEDNYFVVSPSSPIGTLLLRKKVGARFEFNNKGYIILAIT